MDPPKPIAEKVKRFARNLEAYHSGDYKETQLRRYAWSAKLPLSILTDFEELAVYDCRVRPARADTAATARTMYIQYHEYPQRWEEIAAIFSREAVLKGSFDR